LLRNIKRKGCTNAKKVIEINEEQSFENESIEENCLEVDDKNDHYRPTLATIENRTQQEICKPQ